MRKGGKSPEWMPRAHESGELENLEKRRKGKLLNGLKETERKGSPLSDRRTKPAQAYGQTARLPDQKRPELQDPWCVRTLALGPWRLGP